MKILLVTARYPWPPRRGDQIRAVQHLDHLLAGEHEVTLLTPEPGPGEPPPPSLTTTPYEVVFYRRHRGPSLAAGLLRALLRHLPLQSALFYQPDLGVKLRALAPRADLVLLQLVRLAIHLDDVGETPLVVDLIDSLSLNVARRAAVDRPWLRPLLRLEARRLARSECRLAERAARLLVVCDRDRRELADRLPPDLAGRVAVVHLELAERSVGAPLPGEWPWSAADDGPVLALTGNLGYFVNVDATTWWLREVWPRLRGELPDLRVLVAGARPARSVQQAVARADGGGGRVRLVAAPRDLLALLARSTLALAPLRCGSGVPVKVLEAWSVGVPVLASAWAGAGTSGRPGEDFRQVGEDPAEWARAVRELLDDPVERERLAANARRRLAADYARDEVRRQLAAVVSSLTAPAPASAAGEAAADC